MKAFITMAACCLLLCSCQNEETIQAEVGKNPYDVTDQPADFVQHNRFLLYRDYQTYLITAPTVADYLFNFQRKNKLQITAPEQSPTVLKRGIELLHETFLDFYPEAFKKKHLPYSILLAESIIYTAYETIRPEYRAYGANRFLALGGIKAGMESYDEAEKRRFKSEINAAYWIDYLRDTKKLFEIPESFALASGENVHSKGLGDLADNPLDYEDGVTTPEMPDYYKLGFISYAPLTTFYDEQYASWWIETPSVETDLRQWIGFVFSTPKVQREEILKKYPIMKTKYDILRKALLQCENFDINNLP